MKSLIFCLLLTSFLLSGCMDTYFINNYKSPHEFYTIVKNETEGHSLNVKLNSDSTIVTNNLKINSDSTSFFKNYWEIKEGLQSSYPRTEIKNFEYKKFDPSGVGNTALITFNNGKKAIVRNLMANKDSVFITTRLPQKYLVKKKISFPTNEIQSISYNNRFIAMAQDAGIGTLAGFLIAIQASSKIVQPVMGGGSDPFMYDIVGLFAGALSGTLIGAVIGSEQQFLFKNITRQKELTSFGLTGGLNTSGITRANSDYSGSVIFFSYGIFATWSFNKNFSIRSEIIHTTNGGEFSSIANQNKISNYNRTAYLNFIEIPVLFQYSISQRAFHPRFYIGPSFNIFLNGRVDEEGISNQYGFPSPVEKNTRSITSAEVSTPDIGILFGAGVNLLRNITIDVQYNYGFGKYSNSLFSGDGQNLKLHSLMFKLGYEF